MPPSPLLSARIITERYLKAMTQAIDQVMSDRSPSTFSRRGRDAVLRAEALLERVERARADVAEDDAQGAQRRAPATGAWAGWAGGTGAAGELIQAPAPEGVPAQVGRDYTPACCTAQLRSDAASLDQAT